MAAPQIRSKATTTFNDTQSPNVNMPATVNAGDLLLIQFHGRQWGTIAPPSGWTLVSDGTTSADITVSTVTNRQAWYRKTADGTEDGTTLAFDLGAATADGQAAAFAIMDHDPSDPIDVVYIFEDEDGGLTYVSPTSITTSRNDSLVLHGYGGGSNSNNSAFSWTHNTASEETDLRSNNRNSSTVASATQTTAGAIAGNTGTAAVTGSSVTWGTVVVIVIQPPSGATPADLGVVGITSTPSVSAAVIAPAQLAASLTSLPSVAASLRSPALLSAASVTTPSVSAQLQSPALLSAALTVPASMTAVLSTPDPSEPAELTVSITVPSTVSASLQSPAQLSASIASLGTVEAVLSAPIAGAVAVVGRLVDPSGAPIEGARIRVSISVSGATITETGMPVVEYPHIWTDANGEWTVDLLPNAGITPAGTSYIVGQFTESQKATYQIAVPAEPGPHQATDLLL